ncbi:MAG TPA: hypothetical protein PLF30_01160 [Candidatus Moranbacteria bacterium]|jgi:hypothetical protein|nr:hypothetical protein [Candidatus Moranbacteria bacterium]HPX94145.1 hypothetical protein [Candidatus Moranbacteria bacterium]HQB59205.1 hypothetical protein [Candidatus Moranbacteria bacterium]
MYWIYFALFIFIVFVPLIVREGFYVFSAVHLQQITILGIGITAFAAYYIYEKSLKKKLAERISIQKQFNRISKDLTHSYSYIGEINRKLEILKNITTTYPESANLSTRKQNQIYDAIMEGIRLFGKSDKFVLRFVCTANNEILKEIKSYPSLSLNFSPKHLGMDFQFFESDEILMVSSPKAIDGIIACIIVKKKTSGHVIDDLDIMKSMASQALFFFMFMKHKKKISCVM